MWLFLVVASHYTNGRFVAQVDPVEQKFHALTCSRFVNEFLDEREGTPNRRDYEFTYTDGHRLLTTENLCTLCEPQFRLQALFAYAKTTRNGNKYNSVWATMMEPKDYSLIQDLKLEGPTIGIFSARLLERLVCRVPESISTAILSIAPGAYPSADEYLTLVQQQLQKARYFNGTAVKSAVETVKRNYINMTKEALPALATHYAVMHLRECMYVCGYCSIGLFTASNKCSNKQCEVAYSRARQEEVKKKLWKPDKQKSS
jgi:hypothetical protein